MVHDMTSQAIEYEEALASGVARRARGLMGEQRLSQNELRARLGLSKAAMSRRLSGEMEFGLNELRGLADALHTTEAYLLGYDLEVRPITHTPG